MGSATVPTLAFAIARGAHGADPNGSGCARMGRAGRHGWRERGGVGSTPKLAPGTR